ncbi:hypothetical protein SAMN05428954_7172 [Streptomyces sp. 2112.3]|uniref:hypothetical protein n=1 Tax=Streptomyces sp. 2112.3 TaxID=1881023 RepID=UPI0008949CFF|nr:hypothetical protein [Streptomyces sp. 2112.3]SEF18058.1 hypothetical protein SAMN05428954_7172 [Streptomyces sp. 2112.3]
MSAQEERGALTLSPALYDYALHLLQESPDGIPPRRGFPLSRQPERGVSPQPEPGESPPSLEALPLEEPSPEESQAAIREALNPLPDDPATLHRRFTRLGIRDSAMHLMLIQAAVAGLPLSAGQQDAARSLARQLTRTGTTVPAVTAGLALLTRLGTSEDIPYLSVLGLLRRLTRPAVDALDALAPQSAAVVWLSFHARRDELRPLVRALWKSEQAAVREELVASSAEPRLLSPAVARRIAEAARLPDLLGRRPSDTALLARAGGLLVRMGHSRDAPTDLLAYGDALTVYESVVTRAGLLPPTLDNHATLLSLAVDLSSGPGVLLEWPPGRRMTLLDSLERLLTEPRWASLPETETTGGTEHQLRARWIRRTGRQPFRHPTQPGRLRIEVVASDPAGRAPVETRILLDGRPVVPAFFDRGPAHSPEYLLDEGRLRAGPEPNEVQLAEASCTEGCCGALYVTIRRDGDQVVWENWQRPLTMPGSRAPAPEPTAYRFDAAAYDAEIARAETDRSWSWPARTTARLIKAGLLERPDLLSRWDAKRGWISSDFDDPDSTVVTFLYAPGLGSGKPDGTSLQFRWVIPDDGTPPEAQAAAALNRLAEEDPKTYGQVCGGSLERAEALGFSWPERN